MAKPGTILQLLSSSPAPDPLDHTTVYLTLHDTVSEIVITIYHECMGLCSSSLGSAGQSSWITIISLNKLILNFNFSLREDQCLHYLMVYNQVTMQLGLN